LTRTMICHGWLLDTASHNRARQLELMRDRLSLQDYLASGDRTDSIDLHQQHAYQIG
jgi:hypothetical protein